MENLTNEQIIDIINFYQMCGITEDMYLSRTGVKDLFSLIGISPEFDEQGDRVPTVYEQLQIAPVFREEKEVPIVFAIKHKVSKIHKPTSDDKISSEKFTYMGVKEQVNDKVILNKLRQDYFSAIANGNLNEASKIYDLIDKITGGKADFFIAVQYNSVKFYKKMQKQLIIDMFANFVILMVLNEQHTVKEGLIQFDKLYKAFVQKQLKNGNFGLIKSNSIKVPRINKITVSLGENKKLKASNVNVSGEKATNSAQVQVSQKPQEIQTFASFIKEKIGLKLNRIKKSFQDTFFAKKSKAIVEEIANDKAGADKLDSNIKVLESDK